MANTNSKSTGSGAERRKAKRRDILDTFSIFAVVPKKGVHRLPVHDVSDLGIGFDLDTEGENFADFPVKKGESIEVHLYLNQSLYLPLSVEIIRAEEKGSVRRVGAELKDRSSKGAKALLAFLEMLDLVSDTAVIPAR